MEELFFYPVRRPWRASGFARRRLSSRKIVLEMLEASGKRVYSAREIQPVRWLRGRMSRSGEGRAGASRRTTGNGRHYPYEELENPCNQGVNYGGIVAQRGGRRPCPNAGNAG